jgi:hypothetical protein
MYYVGTCKACGMPVLGIRRCSGPDYHFCVMCDECESIWLKPDLEESLYILDSSKISCPYGPESLTKPEARWATREEIESIGWWGYVVDEGTSMEEFSPSD